MKTFRTLKGWHSDPQKLFFHLTACSISYTSLELVNLLALANETKKSEFVDKVQESIIEDLGITDVTNILKSSYNSSKEADKKAVEKALVLFNIGVVLRLKGRRERLSFHHLNGETLSLEHIHAQNSEGLTKKQA